MLFQSSASSSGSSGSGVGGINYITAWNAEEVTGGIAGWYTYADAAGTTPVDGTGGSPTVTWTAQSTNVLRGLKSFRLTKDAADRQGQGVSYDFSIDEQDKNKTVYISFDLSVSANYVTDDVKVFIYDVTNAALIPVTGQCSSARYAGCFSAGTSTSYRLILHITSTNANAWTLDVDTAIVGPSQILDSPIVEYLGELTTTGTWTSNTTYTGKYWRINDTLRGTVNVALSGAPTTASLVVTLPNSYSIAMDKMINTTGDRQIVGQVSLYDSGTLLAVGSAIYSSSTEVLIKYHNNYAAEPSAVALSDVTQEAPFTFANGDVITIDFEVPISNWTNSSALISTTAALNVNKAPTKQIFTTGSGTYTTPTNPRPNRIRVLMLAGGGGGSGSGTSGGTDAGDGNYSSFGSVLRVEGGEAGTFTATVGGIGGTFTINSPAVGFGIVGGNGGGYNFVSSANTILPTGGYGGGSGFGGTGPQNSGNTDGSAGAANSGQGGSGGAPTNTGSCFGGCGGGGGGYLDAVIHNPAATYAYVVGAGGTAGGAGASGKVGGAGGSGIIIVEESYEPDLSVYGVYGNFEEVDATSSAFALNTAGYATGEWAQMTGNSVSLTAGRWLLTGAIAYNESSSTVTCLRCRWSAANGNNTSSTPTDITGIKPAAMSAAYAPVSGSVDSLYPALSQTISLTTQTTVYLNTSVDFSDAGSGAITTYISAIRLQ